MTQNQATTTHTTPSSETDSLECEAGVKSLLCLTTSDHADGRPIDSLESLRRHFPLRLLARLRTVDDDTTFTVSSLTDPRNEPQFDADFSAFYSDPNKRREVTEVGFLKH